MSVLTYPPTNEEEIFRHCTKECGIITSTEDQQYFALGCISCSEKFLYFDAFIEHMQTRHASFVNEKGRFGSGGGVGGSATKSSSSKSGDGVYGRNNNNSEKTQTKRPRMDDDQDDIHPGLLEPPVVMIKEEKIEEEDDDEVCI